VVEMRRKEIKEATLDEVKGAIFTRWFRSADGYIVLEFKRGKQTLRVWIG